MSDIQKWADEAMFKAEPLKASEGPKVYLIWMTPDPLGAVAAMAKMYKGEVVRSLADVTHQERKGYMEQIMRTKLKAPLEAVKLHFMVEGVTRSFTHQMVRQRTAVYAQESLRFAVKEDMGDGVAYPPSLSGVEDFTPEDGGWETNEQEAKRVWDKVVETIDWGYSKLINLGMPAEDARGLLPHNITTRLNYVTDFRALLDHAGNRLCTQAQFEWRVVLSQLAAAIREHQPHDSRIQSIQGLEPESGWLQHLDAGDAWQFEALADTLRPVCYNTGKCEFMADFDRKCSIRERVQANHQIGRTSEHWGEQYGTSPFGPGVKVAHGVEDDKVTKPVFIGPIQPSEWLLDPGAAR